ncbi:glandular kallikrein, prostatic [Osmia lignaria lignaria]|uniref:glandular kallikrein, prostatic n=1 Tax=Osmia lignaria lignaria TaxID=1437193 RepID=UPI00402B977C
MILIMKIHILLFLLLINLELSKSILLRGKRAQNGQFPWLIQFQTIAPCGGVLISSDWVLTAAQCVQDKRNSIVLFATGLNGTDTKQTVSVKATYIHPHYEPYSVLPDRDYNIALMKLTKPFDMCNGKVILPNIPVKYNNNYTPCLIFGWQSYISPSSKVLAKPIQYSEVILNSWKLCTYMIKTSVNYTNVFCAMVEFKDEMKACAGNPGSPVVCENQHRETSLVGIASWTNFSLECGDLPTYLDLDAFRIWINDLIFNDKEIDEWEDNDRLSGTTISYRKTPTEDENLSHIWNKLYIPIFHQFNPINKSSRIHYMPYEEIAKGTIVHRYEEIGKTKNLPNNQMIKSKKNQLSNSNKSMLCKSKKFDPVIKELDIEQLEINDFEFLLPVNSRITVIHSNSLYFLYLIFLYFYIIIYM